MASFLASVASWIEDRPPLFSMLGSAPIDVRHLTIGMTSVLPASKTAINNGVRPCLSWALSVAARSAVGWKPGSRDLATIGGDHCSIDKESAASLNHATGITTPGRGAA